MFRTFWTINFVFLLLCCHSLAQEKRTDFFANRVQPILKKHCVKCHGPKRKKSKLRLDEPRYILKGGRGGAVVVPCEPERSPLILAVSYTDPDLQMPPKKKLSQSDIETLTEWVQHGAVMPGVTGTVTGVSAPPPTFDWTERLKHWCWQAVADVSPPTGKGSPIDRFLAVEREQRGLSTAARANRRTALRRLYFDLSGLPPSPEELRAALADDAPDAWGRTVDRLLESPHFGEQWGRHWLDLMRYAETKGYEFDFDVPNAWRYRDYVIRAFNEDVPYDQIVREHVAGDLLRAPRRNLETGFNESVLGTGFWTFGEAGHSPVDTRADQLEQTANRIDVFSKAFLGLTVACARCHDHKFDAISAKDYYALSGYLHSSSYRQVRFESELQNKDVVLELESLRREAAVALGSPLADALRPAVRSMDRALMNVLQKKESALTGLQLEWAAQLKRSLDDESDPMHPLARFADAQDGATLEKIRLNRSQSSPLLPPNALVIADYSNSQTPWLTNGPVFGSRASRIGDIVLSSDPEWPIKRIGTNSAAVRDPFWDDLSLKTGTQIESGGVAWQQAGRTIRTPSFQLKSGVLHYLVKGPFHGLVVLDDYRIVKGPLYNSAARSFKAKKALRWVRHDLSDYKGKVAHIEFSAEASSPFELLCVIDSKGAPSPIKARYANDWITSVFDQRDGVSLSELTRQYRRLFERALKRLSKNELSLSPDASDLIDWIVRHPKLFPIDEKGRQQLSATATVFIQRRSALRERMLSQSATAPALMDGSGLTEHILIRGNHKTPGGPAPRQPLTGTSGVVLQPIVSGSGRLQLSEHLTNPKHPLLARVMVNRIWHHVFGRGLVASTDNFGALGERPSHPELLDWLSGEFVRNGWSVKTLIRELVMTDTYRLDSNPVAESSALDPLNLYLHQMPLRRMTAEVLRDHLLKTSGRLDTTLSGRSVPVHLTSFMQGRGRPAKSGPLDGAGRRSIYIAIRRNFLAPFLLAFDFPLPISTVGRRTVSNVPAQALALMNDPFVLNMANHWARQNLLTQPTLTPTARVSELYEGGFGRPATDAESKRALSFIHDLAPDARNEKEVLAAWTAFCHVLINAKEFWYVR